MNSEMHFLCLTFDFALSLCFCCKLGHLCDHFDTERNISFHMNHFHCIYFVHGIVFNFDFIEDK